jgi:hypothetical protein
MPWRLALAGADMFRPMMMALALALSAACAHSGPIGATAAAASVVSDQASARHQAMLDRLVGRWVLTGVIAGQSTVHDVEAAWVLQRNYVRITEVSRERTENGLPAYEATIFIGWLEDHYVCFWFDNTEVASGDVTCSAAEAPDSIPLQFRDGQGALIFTNTFSYDRTDDAWEWRMDNVRNGVANQFALVSLRRR